MGMLSVFWLRIIVLVFCYITKGQQCGQKGNPDYLFMPNLLNDSISDLFVNSTCVDNCPAKDDIVNGAIVYYNSVERNFLYLTRLRTILSSRL